MAKENTDFQRIILDLVKAGWRETGIANAIGVTQSNISQIKRGLVKQPRYDLGVALVQLHKKEMRKFKVRQTGPKSATGS
jgi:hypothetical protein